MRLRRPSKRESPSEDWEDAKLAIQEFGNWIKNADTKTTILTAALGLTITAVASRSTSIATSYQSPETGGWTLNISLVLFGVTVLGMLVFVHSALKPRTKSKSTANRFSWSSMARRQTAPKSLPNESVVEEAWAQAFDLAQIASKKYSAFRWALWFYFAVLVSSGGVIASSSLTNVPDQPPEPENHVTEPVTSGTAE